jgi:hypothetical protein
MRQWTNTRKTKFGPIPPMKLDIGKLGGMGQQMNPREMG